MSMVTFNLHHDREDWPRRRRTILAELKRLQPDAVALQEVIQRRNVRNQAQWLASQLGRERFTVCAAETYAVDPARAVSVAPSSSVTRTVKTG